MTSDAPKMKNKEFWSEFFAIISILFFGITSFFVVYLKFKGFLLDSGDSAVAEQALWNSIHGDWFYQSFLEAPNNFREHINFIQLLFLPFYYVIPSLLTAYAVIFLAFMCSAFVFFRYAREKIGGLWALFLTVFFLFQPITIWQNIGPMHVVAVAAPLLMLTLILYEKQRYSAWLIAMFVFSMTSEFVFPTAIMLGILALIESRSWKWILPPMLAGISMYAMAASYITIGFGDNQRLISLFEPRSIFSAKFGKRIGLIEEFFRPVLYLPPLFSKYILLAIPTIIAALVVVDNSRLSSGSHIFSLIPVILAFALLDIFSRIKENVRIALALVVVIGTGLTFPIISPQFKIRANSKAETMREAVSLVKDSGSVTVTRPLSTHLSHRHDFYLPDNKEFTDYVILKTNFFDSKNSFLGEYRKSVETSGEYEKVLDRNEILVFIKKEKLKELSGE